MNKICALLVMVILASGCETWKRAYVAVHDAIDAELAGQTNTPPVIVLPVADKPATVKPDVLCGCDLSIPLCDPPWTGAELKEAGNSMECPVYAGRDIRWAVWYPSDKETHLVAKPFEKAVQYDGNKFKVTCFERDGYRYHIQGYSHNRRGKTANNQVPADGWMPYKTTTFVYSECRKVNP